MTTRPLSVELVRSWAQDALDGWLTGHGELDETAFAGYLIRKTRHGTYEVTEQFETEVDRPARSYMITPVVIDLDGPGCPQ